MKTFLVFEPKDGDTDAETADRVIFLRERFRWLALFLAPLWLLWNRLWLAFVLWLVAVIALAVAAYALGYDPETSAPVLWLPTLVVAFEATELLRRKLLRRGYREAAVVVARDLEDAERRFFASWTPARPRVKALEPERPAPPVSVPSTQPNTVIGLFPQPGGGR